MKFSLDLGVIEKHRLDCETVPLWGLFVIKIDNIERAKIQNMVLSPRCQKHSLDIGIHERIQVTVEKVRKTFCREIFRVFVNGRLVKCVSGQKAIPIEDSKEAPDGLPA